MAGLLSPERRQVPLAMTAWPPASRHSANGGIALGGGEESHVIPPLCGSQAANGAVSRRRGRYRWEMACKGMMERPQSSLPME